MSGYEIPTKIRGLVNARSLLACERCGGHGTELHHRKRGNPRLHAVANLVRLCRVCHALATKAPAGAVNHGWVLRGRVTAESCSATPVAMLGRVWAFLQPSGEYLVAGASLSNMGEILELAQVERGPRFVRGVFPKPGASPVGPRMRGDVGLGQPGFFIPVGEVDLPAEFVVQPGESFVDFLARLPEEHQPVNRIT